MNEKLHEHINNWRVIPRVMVGLYGWIFYEVVHWFMTLPDPNGSQATFVSAIIGAAAGFFGFYVNSGVKRD